MALEDDLLKALKERVLRATQDMPFGSAPSININNSNTMPRTVSEALSAGGGKNVTGQESGQGQGMTPEELEYLVEINKRDVFEEGQDKAVGWDKTVHRYTQPKAKDRGFKGK